jgi:hypothetical protein
VARFVEHPDFSGSRYRRDLWLGFLEYLGAWAEVEEEAGVEDLLLSVWLGGSFISTAPNPQDVDISPLVNTPVLDSISGKRGSGKARKLIQHRGSIVDRYRVEPFPILWHPIMSTFRLPVDPQHRDYLFRRGGMDDWWQRVRPPGPKGPPQAADARARRGYVEVIL